MGFQRVGSIEWGSEWDVADKANLDQVVRSGMIEKMEVFFLLNSIDGNMLKSGKSSVCANGSSTAVPNYYSQDPRFDGTEVKHARSFQTRMTSFVHLFLGERARRSDVAWIA